MRLVLLASFSAGLCFSEDAAMVGLTKTRVMAQELDVDFRMDAGFSHDQLERDIEAKLRAAGIQVVPLSDPDAPIFLVTVGTIQNVDRTQWVFSIAIAVKELAELNRSLKVETLVSSWSTSWFGVVGRNKSSSLRRDVNREVDRFVDVWKSANSAAMGKDLSELHPVKPERQRTVPAPTPLGREPITKKY